MTKPVTRKMAVDCLLHRMTMPGQWSVVEYWDAGSDIATRVVQIHCGICGKPLAPGDAIQFDHIHADVFQGPHEYQNLRPVHYDPCHKEKSARDVKAKAKGDRLLGLTKNKPKPKMRSKPFQKIHRPMQKRIP